jgi:hypothetical protein
MRTRRFIPTALGAAAVAALLLAAPVFAAKKVPTASVEGKVFYRGKPLPGGTVAFYPAKGKPVVARIQKDGTYSAPKVPVGKVKVTVETESVRPKGKKKANPPKDQGNPPKRDKKQSRYVPIPRKYASPKTSGLEYEVKKGTQTFDIQLD